MRLKYTKIPRQVLLLGIISFFTDFASEMLYPITPIFLTAVLGASMATVGLIEGIAEAIAGFLKGFFGSLSDKLGKRSIFVVLGYGLSAIVKPLPGFFPFISTIVFSRTIDRVGKGIRTAPRDALLAGYSGENTGAIFGFHRSLDTLGAVVGPLAALGLLALFPGDYILIFFAAIVPSVFAVFFTFRVKDRPVSISADKKYHYLNFWKTAPRQYKLLLIFLTAFSFVNSSDVFLILKSKVIAQSDMTAILGYIFYNFIYALFSYPMGILADKFGKRNIFTIGLFIFSAVYLGFALNESFMFIWLLFALYGIYTASTEGVAKAWIADLIPDEYRGTGIGLLTALTSFAMMAGSFATGILWDLYGPSVPFILSAIVSGIIAFSLLFLRILKPH